MVVLLFLLVKDIYIIYTNDIHGHVGRSRAVWIDRNFPPEVGNGYVAPVIIEQFRRKAEREGGVFLLLDAGDIFQGTPIGDFSEGRVMVDYFNRCGYDFIAIGNHDFDRGYWVIDTLRRRTEIPFLSANLFKKKDDTLINFAIPYRIFERGGIRFGIFSVITQYLAGQVPPKFLDSIVVKREIPVVREVVGRIRDSVDILIGLTHVGVRHDRRIADSVPGIDIIVGGHSHTGIRTPEERGPWSTIIVQTYGKLTTIGYLHVRYDTELKEIVGYDGELIDLISERFPLDDDSMAAIIKSYEGSVMKGFKEVVGELKNDLTRSGWTESTAGDLITDAMRWRFKTDVAIHNSGGIRGDLKKGPVTYEELYDMLPFENYCIILKVKGSVLKEILEVGVNGHHAIFQLSGVRIRYDESRPIGDRILSIEVEGKGFHPDSIYTIVTNSFLAAGGGDYSVFLKYIDREDTYYLLRDVVAEYIREHSPLEVKVEDRIVKVVR